jgi:NCS1 family nucleobase:cation symporter-1
MLGNYGTMAVNINDFARYARSTKMIFGQILVIPLSFMLMSFMGVIIAGAASDYYGETIWDPLTIMSHWSGSSEARAAAAFVSLSFVLAQLGSNISANCVSAANDLNAMFPSVSQLGHIMLTYANETSISTYGVDHILLLLLVRRH